MKFSWAKRDYETPVMLRINDVDVCRSKDIIKITIDDEGVLRVHHRLQGGEGLGVSCFPGFWLWVNPIRPDWLKYLPSPTEDATS